MEDAMWNLLCPGIESDGSDEEDDPEDNIPLVNLSGPATKQSTEAANAATLEAHSVGAPSQLLMGQPLSTTGASCTMQTTAPARSVPADASAGGAALEYVHPQPARAMSPIENRAFDSCMPATHSSPDGNAEHREAPRSCMPATDSSPDDSPELHEAPKSGKLPAGPFFWNFKWGTVRPVKWLVRSEWRAFCTRHSW